MIPLFAIHNIKKRLSWRDPRIVLAGLRAEAGRSFPSLETVIETEGSGDFDPYRDSVLVTQDHFWTSRVETFPYTYIEVKDFPLRSVNISVLVQDRVSPYGSVPDMFRNGFAGAKKGNNYFLLESDGGRDYQVEVDPVKAHRQRARTTSWSAGDDVLWESKYTLRSLRILRSDTMVEDLRRSNRRDLFGFSRDPVLVQPVGTDDVGFQINDTEVQIPKMSGSYGEILWLGHGDQRYSRHFKTGSMGAQSTWTISATGTRKYKY